MVPETIRTARLVLRCWRTRDAEALAHVIECNVHRLGGWIPAHVASTAPLSDLKRRLTRFATKFREDRCWRYAIFSGEHEQLLGEVSLFPRNAERRTPLHEADRLEIGYWLREEATGHGYATEAAEAMLELAKTIGGIQCIEIRCDPRNARSAAVALRLSFELVDTGVADRELQDAVYVSGLGSRAEPNVGKMRSRPFGPT